MKRIVALGVLVAVLLGLGSTASAERSSQAVAATGRLEQLGIIELSKGTSEIRDPLLSPLTRAETVAVIIKALGREAEGRRRKGEAAFPDTGSHWASGQIAVAREIAAANGFVLGMPGGSFEPQRNVTPAEVLAFLEKLLGVPVDPSLPWPDQALQSASLAGIVSPMGLEALLAVAEQPTDRYLCFYLLDSAFFSYKLPDGKTVYTKYVKPNPSVITLEPPDFAPGTNRLTIRGQVSGDTIEIYISGNGDRVRIPPDAEGRFTYETTVSGPVEMIVTAVDLAGNQAHAAVKFSGAAGSAEAAK